MLPAPLGDAVGAGPFTGADAVLVQLLAQVVVGHDQVDQRAVLRARHVELTEGAGLPRPDGALGVGALPLGHTTNVGSDSRGVPGTFGPFFLSRGEPARRGLSRRGEVAVATRE